ncbi:MAG: hypothetical protein ACI8ZB_002776 [Desulforhopalus sp.]|jgi:hypothetical protein
MTNSIRRGVCGEPATEWRSLEITDHAEVVVKAMIGRITWLEVERQEGKAQ